MPITRSLVLAVSLLFVLAGSAHASIDFSWKVSSDNESEFHLFRGDLNFNPGVNVYLDPLDPFDPTIQSGLSLNPGPADVWVDDGVPNWQTLFQGSADLDFELGTTHTLVVELFNANNQPNINDPMAFIAEFTLPGVNVLPTNSDWNVIYFDPNTSMFVEESATEYGANMLNQATWNTGGNRGPFPEILPTTQWIGGPRGIGISSALLYTKVTPTPEPGTMALLGSGVLAGFWLKRRKKKAAAA